MGNACSQNVGSHSWLSTWCRAKGNQSSVVNMKYSRLFQYLISLTCIDPWTHPAFRPDRHFHLHHNLARHRWAPENEFYKRCWSGRVSSPLPYDLYLGAGACHVAPPLLYSSVEVRERSLSFLQVKSLQLGIRVTLHDAHEAGSCLFVLTSNFDIFCGQKVIIPEYLLCPSVRSSRVQVWQMGVNPSWGESCVSITDWVYSCTLLVRVTLLLKDRYESKRSRNFFFFLRKRAFPYFLKKVFSIGYSVLKGALEYEIPRNRDRISKEMLQASWEYDQ